MSLVTELCNKLNLTEEQAQGAAGLALNLLKQKLAAADFAKVAKAVPEAPDLQDAAPDTGIVGALAGLAGKFGGQKAEGLGDLAQLATGFAKLNISKETLAQFAPVVIDFLSKKGGKGLKDILLQVLK